MLFSEINATIIASESHVIALKVGNKLTNFRNAPLFITSVPNSPGSSFRHIHFVKIFTFVSSQLPGLVTFTTWKISQRGNNSTLKQMEVVNVVELKLGCLSNLGFLSKLVSQD